MSAVDSCFQKQKQMSFKSILELILLTYFSWANSLKMILTSGSLKLILRYKEKFSNNQGVIDSI